MTESRVVAFVLPNGATGHVRTVDVEGVGATKSALQKATLNKTTVEFFRQLQHCCLRHLFRWSGASAVA